MNPIGTTAVPKGDPRAMARRQHAQNPKPGRLAAGQEPMRPFNPPRADKDIPPGGLRVPAR